MPSYTSKKLRFTNAEQFKETFSETTTPTVGYIFISKHLPYANDSVAVGLADNVRDEKSVWNDMIAAKKITGNDVQLVIPRVTWTANSKYIQYDDTITLEGLVTANASQNLKQVYVINSEGNVYKCLSNNKSALSTAQPIGQNLPNQGIISTADDYLWKYLYNVLANNKFSTNNWIPAPVTTSQLEFSGSSSATIDGELTTIVVANGGFGYVNTNVSVSSFNVSCTVLTVGASIDIPNTISLFMGVSGTGVQGGTYITAIDAINRKINLNYGTASSGGGANGSNSILIFTRTEIIGDGELALASPVLSNSSIQKIIVTNYGSGYTWANVNIYGTAKTANTANARVVLPPKFGHGYNSAKELGAHNVMVNIKIGDVDSTEGNLISTNTSFRQYGLLTSPYKYGQSVPVTNITANSVISQTTNVTVIAGVQYDVNEFVYQGNTSLPTFSGYVNSQESNVVKLTNIKGSVSIGSVLKGTTTNPTGRTVFSIQYPEFERYTGDVLYAENFLVIERDAGQAENIKFIVKF